MFLIADNHLRIDLGTVLEVDRDNLGLVLE
jgi:hypothetical protein